MEMTLDTELINTYMMNTSVSPVGHNGYQQQYWQNLPVSPVLIFALSSIPGLLLPTTSVLLSKSAPLE